MCHEPISELKIYRNSLVAVALLGELTVLSYDVSFSALTLLVEWHTEHLAHKDL